MLANLNALIFAIVGTIASVIFGALVQVYYSKAPLFAAWDWPAVLAFLFVFLASGWILQRRLIRRR